MNIGNVTDPSFVGCVNGEFSLQYIWHDGQVMFGIRRYSEFPFLLAA